MSNQQNRFKEGDKVRLTKEAAEKRGEMIEGVVDSADFVIYREGMPPYPIDGKMSVLSSEGNALIIAHFSDFELVD